MRLFIAVTIPDELKDRIADIQARLRSAPADVKWVAKENFHITLKFLGDVPEEKVDPLVASMTQAVAGCPPFDLSFKGVGAFPGVRSPRVVWLGIDQGVGELSRLAENLDRELDSQGFKKEKRGFSGHLTLGRVRSPQNKDELVKRIAALSDAGVDAFTVRSVDLMQSFLHPHGSHYQCLRSISI
jgi:2'-5' RNA ligase